MTKLSDLIACAADTLAFVSDTSDTTCFVAFINAAAPGNYVGKYNANLTFNASTGVLGATGFSGPLTGNASSATYASALACAAESADATCFPLFVTDSAAGNYGGKVNTNLKFDSSTSTLESLLLKAVTSVTTPSLISPASSALTITPAAGYNLNVALSGAGDLVVNTNQLVVDTSTGYVGIGTATPKAKVHSTVGFLANYNCAYALNAYYDTSWKYVANGTACGVVCSSTTYPMVLRVAPNNTSGADAALTFVDAVRIGVTGDVEFAGNVNIPSTFAYKYNSVNAITATTANNNWNFGPSGGAADAGTYHTAVGTSCFASVTGGTYGFAAGSSAAYGMLTANQVIAIGRNAGRYITDAATALTIATNCLYIGDYTRALADNAINEIVIGNNVTGAGNNSATLGGTGILTTILRGAVSGPTSISTPSLISPASSALTITPASGYDLDITLAGAGKLDITGPVSITGLITSTTTTSKAFYHAVTCDQESHQSVYAGQTASTLQDGSANTGTDETFDYQWEAFSFVASGAHNVRSLVLRLKTSATLDSPSSAITAYIYTDVSGSPGAQIVASQPMRFGALTTSMALYRLGAFNAVPAALTPGATYWIVLKYSSVPSGGVISIDTAATGTGTWSHSSDGTTWVNEDGKSGYFKLDGRVYYGGHFSSVSSIGVYGSSITYYGVRGSSTSYYGVYGSSVNSVGVLGTSDHYIGTYGQSINNYGVYGSSTNSTGVYGISTNNYSGYFTRNTATPTSAVPVCYVLQDHASDTNTAFRVRQDGTGYIQDWYNSTTLRAGITAAGSFNVNAIGSLTSSGLTVTPSAGYSLAVALSGAGDFIVNTNQLVVDTSAARVGVNNATPSYSLDVTGDFRCTTGFGCNGTTPQTAYASGGALAAYGTGAFGFDTEAHASALYAMVVAIRAALVADGIMS